MYENEMVLVAPSPNTKNWFDRMTKVIPAIIPDAKPTSPQEFAPIVGLAHHLRFTKWGIEGVLKAPKAYHRWRVYVLYDVYNQPNEPFWVVLHK